MRTYYVVEHVDEDGDKYWQAHTGLRARLGIFDFINEVPGTLTFIGADECESRLRVALVAKEVKPKVVRVVLA